MYVFYQNNFNAENKKPYNWSHSFLSTKIYIFVYSSS